MLLPPHLEPRIAQATENVDYAELVHPVWTINGIADEEMEAEDAETSVIFNWFSEEFRNRNLCPYCSTVLARVEYRREHQSEYAVPFVALWLCRSCFFWQYFSDQDADWQPEQIAAVPYQKRFDDSLPEACHQELIQHLLRHPKLWNTINATKLEHLVESIFRANFSDAEVIHMGRSGDCGTDILYVDSARNEWIIQVKGRKSPKHTEGFETLQKLLGTLYLENRQHGIIVSTADHFSYFSEQQANRVQRTRGVRLEFIDRGKLVRMARRATSPYPWEFFLRRELKETRNVEDYDEIKDYFRQVLHMPELHFTDVCSSQLSLPFRKLPR